MLSATLTIVALFAHAQEKSINSVMESKALKQFSLLVRVPTNYTPGQVKAAGVIWDQLLEKWKSQKIYVISFAFPGDSYVVSGSEKTITHESVVTNNLRAVSNIVLLAADIQAASAIAREIPVLAYGGSVEVREVPKPLIID